MYRAGKGKTKARMAWVFVALILSILPRGAHAGGFDHSHQQFTDILREHVANGMVDYSRLKSDRGALDAYLESLALVSVREFQSWGQDRQLAFLINLYNAETIQLILDNYPVDSIKDIGGLFTKPWDIKTVRVFGKTITLNAVEHDMIRKNYAEPRIHFALVCAARGCPPLRSEAYQAGSLDAQLDDQARTFFNDKDKNWIDTSSNTVHLSPIFKWYKEDFQAGARGVQYFLRLYGPKESEDPLRREIYSIRYTHYDWALNDRRTSGKSQ